MRLLPFLLFLGIGIQLFAQEGDLPKHDNGLIYSQQTMIQLGQIVDSLDLQYRSCSPDRVYQSLSQCVGSYFFIKEKDADKIFSQLAKVTDIDDLRTAFPKAKIETNLLLVYRSYEEDEITKEKIFSPPLNFGYPTEVHLSTNKDKIINDKDGVYATTAYEGVHGFIRTTAWKSQDLSYDYARMLQYVDCMVDTSSLVFLPVAKDDNLRGNKSANPTKPFQRMLDDYPGAPVYDDKMDDEEWEEYSKRFREWQSARNQYVEDTLSKSKKFQRMLKQLDTKIWEGHAVNEQVERYLIQYGYAETALQSKRLRRVWGQCSQDDSPRLHAMEIAKLSASCIQWDVFLRAHLDIMNDRFPRATDGSYAWGQRGTYIAELEALQLDVPQLLIGSCLSASELPEYHYRGNWRRIGRALAESKEKKRVEEMLLKMIGDSTLDDYNRLGLTYVFRNYLQWIKDESEQSEKKQVLARTLAFSYNPILSQIDLEE